MPIKYHLRFSDDHYLSSQARYRQQLESRIPHKLLKWIVASLVLAALFFLLINGVMVGFVVLLAALVILRFSPKLETIYVRTRFAKSPYRNSDVVFTLSDSGVHVVGEYEESRLGWQLFTKARRFNDGLLLFQGPRMFSWLPDSAAAESDAISKACGLVQRRISDYRVIL